MTPRKRILLTIMFWFVWVFFWFILMMFVTAGNPATWGRFVFATLGPVAGFFVAPFATWVIGKLQDEYRKKNGG